MITVDSHDALKDLDKLRKQFGHAKVNQAMLSAIRHTLGIARTEASRVIRETYKIPVAKANASMKIRTIKADGAGGPVGALMASGSRTSIASFKPTITTSAGIRMVTTKQGAVASQVKPVRRVKNTQMQVEIIKGKRVTINSAFFLPSSPRAVVMARGKHTSDKTFIWRHKRITPAGASDSPINALSTVSVFKAITTERAQSRIETKVKNAYEARFLHEISRLSTPVTG